MPNWKNDALLLVQLIKKMQWQQFDIIAHSLGSLIASFIAIAIPEQISRLIFLDVLGPRYDFIQYGITYLQQDTNFLVKLNKEEHEIFPNKESIIKDRMKKGDLNYQAADALVSRGAKSSEEGWSWTYDRRLSGVSLTLPYEDEIRAIFRAIQAPVCLIKARNGLQYPPDIFQERSTAIKDLTINEVDGGHHVHMNDPLLQQLFQIFLVWIEKPHGAQYET